MTEQEAQALIREGAAIDADASEHAEAAAAGNLDARGQIVAPDPDARAMEWFIIPKTLAWAITAILPETAPHYTDAKCMELARAIVPVADKYGLAGIGDSPELMLLAGTVGFGAPAYMAYQQRKRQAAEAARAAAEQGGDGSRE